MVNNVVEKVEVYRNLLVTIGVLLLWTLIFFPTALQELRRLGPTSTSGIWTLVLCLDPYSLIIVVLDKAKISALA